MSRESHLIILVRAILLQVIASYYQLKDESGKNTINLTELEQSLSCLLAVTKVYTIGVVELDI